MKPLVLSNASVTSSAAAASRDGAVQIDAMGKGATESLVTTLTRLGISAVGKHVLAFVIVVPARIGDEQAPIASGTAKLTIGGQEKAGDWTTAILLSLDPPTAVVRPLEDKMPDVKVEVHVDQLRAVPEPLVGVENKKPPRAADATREGKRISDNDEGLYDPETCNDEYAHGVLRHAITHTHVTSSQGHASLAVEIVPGDSLGNTSKRTCVLRVKATTPAKAGGIVLAPCGGMIVDLSLGEKKKAYTTNPSTITTVPAKVIAATEPPTIACFVPKVPRTTNFAIVSPLVDFNLKKTES